MKVELIVSILENSSLSEKEKFETICNNLQEYCLQPNHILNCYRVLNTLKLELAELFKDADSDAEKILRLVSVSFSLIFSVHSPEHTFGMLQDVQR